MALATKLAIAQAAKWWRQQKREMVANGAAGARTTMAGSVTAKTKATNSMAYVA